MKKNIFICKECKHQIKTGDRDSGRQPMVIGCTQPNCDGIAKTSFYLVNQTIVPESIFIKPKNTFEWDAIRKELESNIRESHPKKKDRKVMKMKSYLMLRIKDHVKNGGLVILPKPIVDDLPEIFNIVK